MTVSVDDELRIREYAGDDSATARAVPFKFLDNDDLKVTLIGADGSETVLVRGTHYSVTGAGSDSGGSVTPLLPIASGTSWRIEGDMPLAQPTDYTAGDDFPAESHERGLDRAMIAHQEVRRDLNETRDRAVQVPRGSIAPGLDMTGLIDGDLLVYSGGKLLRANFLSSAGKFAAFGSQGHLIGADALAPDIVPALAVNIGTDGGGNVQQDLDAFGEPEGSQRVGFLQVSAGLMSRDLEAKSREFVSFKDYGAIGDGTLHTVAEWIIPGALGRYASLEALQDDYPHVTDTTDSIDWAAAQKALNLVCRGGQVTAPRGKYVTNKPLTCFTPGVEILGLGSLDTESTYVVGAVILKTGDFNGLVCSGYNTRVTNMSFIGQTRTKGSGAGSGHGLVIAGRGCAVDRVVARYNGGCGVLINAEDADGTADAENSHWVQLTNGFTEYNGQDGVKFYSPNSGKMNMNIVFNWTSRHNDGAGYNNAAGSYMEYENADAEYNLGFGIHFSKGSYSTLVNCHTEQNEGGNGSVDTGDGVRIDDSVIQVRFIGGTYGEGGGGSDFEAGISYDTGATQQDRDLRVMGKFYKNRHMTPTSSTLGLRDMSFQALNYRAVASAAAGFSATVTPAAGLELTAAFYAIRTSATEMEARIAVGKNGTTQEKGGVDMARFSLAAWAPAADDTLNLGSASLRFKEMFCANATINTSDSREKEQVSEIPDEWLDIWGEVEWSRYKWQAAVAEKGDAARWHFGLVAQHVRDVFASHGVDASEIGLLCHDEWSEEIQVTEVLDEDGKPTGEVLTSMVLEAGDRWGLRYQEANAFEAAWQRREINRMREEIELLKASD